MPARVSPPIMAGDRRQTLLQSYSELGSKVLAYYHIRTNCPKPKEWFLITVQNWQSTQHRLEMEGIFRAFLRPLAVSDSFDCHD